MKYERHTSGEEFDSIWYYDTDITSNGPVSVVHKWHKNYKQIQTELKQSKLDKKRKKNEAKQIIPKSSQPKSKHVSGRNTRKSV
jgi:hypothetical protein